MRTAQLSEQEKQDKLDKHTVKKQNGGTALTSKPPPGLVTWQLREKIIEIAPWFKEYSVGWLGNLLAPNCPRPLEPWLIELIARALRVSWLDLLPLQPPGERLPGTALTRSTFGTPSELEQTLEELAVTWTSLADEDEDAAARLLRTLRDVGYKARFKLIASGITARIGARFHTTSPR